jgi:hypothetical protein
MKQLNTIGLLVGILLWSGGWVSAQLSATVVHGRVLSEKGEPLVGVNLQIQGTYEGTITDAEGYFSFQSEMKGPQILIANYFGYRNVNQPVEIPTAADSLHVDLVFEKQTIELEEVVVSDVRQLQTTEKAKATVLSTIDVLATAVDGNVQSAMQTLNGVQPASEQTGLFIRGGTGRETQTFVDGMRVDDFNYGSPANMAGSSRFSPNMFKGTFLSTGGFSAKYGQAISGALILETKDMPVQSSAEFGLSPLFMQGAFERLTASDQLAFGGSVNYQNTGLFLRLMPTSFNFTDFPETAEGTAHLKWQPRPGAILKVYSSYGQTGMAMFQENLDQPGFFDHTRIANRNVFSQATWNSDLSNRWELFAGLGYGRRATDLEFGLGNSEGDDLIRTSAIFETNELYQARTGLSYRNGYNAFEVGAESQLMRDNIAVDGLAPALAEQYSALYAEGNRRVWGRLVGRAGLRLEHTSLRNEVFLSPRASMSYLLSRQSQFFASYGTFVQRPQTNFLYRNPELAYERSQHYIFGFHRNSNKRTFRVEAYTKNYDRLLTLQPELGNEGTGHARGFELFYRDRQSIRGVDYWLSYSFVDAERRYLDYPIAAQPSFVANQVVNLTVKKFIPNPMINFGATYTYAAGRPYYNPNRPPEEFLADRTMDYHNLNLNIAYLPRIGNTFSVIVLTMYNALGFRQVFSYEYSSVNPEIRRPILPTTERYLFLGFFMNFGIDRTNDIIDRQLN